MGVKRQPSRKKDFSKGRREGGIDRRTFLRRSGLSLGGAAVAGMLPFSYMQKASAQEKEGSPTPGAVEIRHTICTHCSVGCGVLAEVQNGVWIGQEPDFDSPFNLGSHCTKGASVRDDGLGDRRVKYPMKLVDGKWKRLPWDQAINEIGDKLLKIRDTSGPDAVFWCGSSKASNEGAYLQRKFAAFWGTNNCDHQARICHSTTVAGVANTWGYGAMTNSYNDMHNCKAMLFVGSNAAEAHPVAMQHVLRGKENGAVMIVVDPRFTRTAAHADQYVRLRPGTDVAFMWGLLWHIFNNGWEDSEYIRQRVYGMDEVRPEIEKWPPDVVADVTGVPEEQVLQVAKTMAENRPGTIVWCKGAWKHWARVWDVDYEWLKSCFDRSRQYDAGGGKLADTMNIPGIPVSRWIDGILEDKNNLSQKDNFRAVFFQGHACNSQTRGPEMKQALEKLELVVISDPYPTHMAVMSEREKDTYLLPTCTQFETYGSVTASNRSIQWREKVIEPLYESLPDHVILYKLAKKFGFADRMFKNIRINGEEPLIEEVLQDINRGTWTIGYTGQSPERLKLHAKHRGTFNTTTLKAEGGPADGEYYGLPWPCWGTPAMKHPGTPLLYDPSKSVAEGGLTFRARFGVERDGVSLLADGSYSKGSQILDGYPEFSADMLKQLGWWDDLNADEKKEAEGKNWKTDLSGGIQRVAIKHGCAPFGNAKARCVVWSFPDTVPVHREPLYTPCYELVARYPTYGDRKAFWRLPTRYQSIQAKDYSREYPIVFISGRLVEYEGGGAETRSNRWLAKLQPDMFAEINPVDANNAGIKDKDWIWLEGPEGGRIKVRATVTPRVAAGVTWTPFHFGGWFQGKDLVDRYPEETAPYVRGEACNTATTYGYDSVTQMQETKATLCRILRV